MDTTVVIVGSVVGGELRVFSYLGIDISQPLDDNLALNLATKRVLEVLSEICW
jgi:hypothetical protein